jgi:GntR family transcriptional regulator
MMSSVPPFEPEPNSPIYLYVQVADHVAARIQAGDLRPGARLPNENEFGDEYGVSLGTARRAVQELRDRGLVQTVPIKGTFVVTK